jgi:AcrR family transcriptional regulator
MRSRTTPLKDSDAASRILQAASDLYAAKGLDRVSLRELTARAGVNLAAVSYHFGSKEGLAEAVFEDLSRRINGKRVADLDAYLASLGGERPALDPVLTIFIDPYLGAGSEQQGVLLARFIVQHRLAPSALTRKVIRAHFDPMAQRFIAALALACPGIATRDIAWRYMFMVSAMVLTLTDTTSDNRIARLSGGEADPSRTEDLRSALLDFLRSGFSPADAGSA